MYLYLITDSASAKFYIVAETIEDAIIYYNNDKTLKLSIRNIERLFSVSVVLPNNKQP